MDIKKACNNPLQALRIIIEYYINILLYFIELLVYIIPKISQI